MEEVEMVAESLDAEEPFQSILARLDAEWLVEIDACRKPRIVE